MCIFFPLNLVLDNKVEFPWADTEKACNSKLVASCSLLYARH